MGTKVANAQPLMLETDKQIYVAGERVGFKCTLTESGQYSNSILYVDVCGEGYLITSQLLKPASSQWDSFIQIPDTVQTGVYLLRAYVGNQQGEPLVVAKPISVINRFMNNDVNTKRQAKAGYLALDMRGLPEAVNAEYLRLQVNKRVVSTNDKIELHLSTSIEHQAGDLCVKVFKAQADLTASAPTAQFPLYTPSESVHVYNHLVLAGKLTDAETHNATEDETIILSSPDSVPSVNYAFTGPEGEFKFVLDNLYGQQDIIIQTLNKKQKFTIELHPFLLLPPKKIPYYIPEDVEQSDFVQLAIKRETMHQAYAKEQQGELKTKQEPIPFYGHTSTRVYPGRFVPLVDFEEIAWEILPIVRYKNNKDSTYMTIWNPNSKGFFDSPWTLVDGIPVYDLSQINKLNSDKINWVEIQPQVRCYGSIMMKGLVDIQTKTGNFTEVDLPKNAIRTTIETFYNGDSARDSKDFVFKDVLYWNAKFSAENQQKLSLKSSYEKGSYVAVAEAYDTSGKVFRTLVPFQVK